MAFMQHIHTPQRTTLSILEAHYRQIAICWTLLISTSRHDADGHLYMVFIAILEPYFCQTEKNKDNLDDVLSPVILWEAYSMNQHTLCCILPSYILLYQS